MSTIITQRCPKCNSQKLYKYGKDKQGNQKYQCRICKHQFAPDVSKKDSPRKYPSCPVCGKSSFLHHDYADYSNYRCSDKKCNHSFFQPKPTVKLPTSMSGILGKTDFKRMRHSLHTVITALTLFYIGGSSFRKIAYAILSYWLYRTFKYYCIFLSITYVFSAQNRTTYLKHCTILRSICQHKIHIFRQNILL